MRDHRQQVSTGEGERIRRGQQAGEPERGGQSRRVNSTGSGTQRIRAHQENRQPERTAEAVRRRGKPSSPEPREQAV